MITTDAAQGSSSEQRPAEAIASANPESPGQTLRQARETKNLDINYVATALRLSPDVIELLERDDYSGLPSAVFVSGYIRSYARLMDIDPEPLNRQFRVLHPEAEAPPRHFARPEQDMDRRASSNLLLYLMTALVILALTAGVYGWWSNRPQPNGTADTDPDAAPASSTTTEQTTHDTPAASVPVESSSGSPAQTSSQPLASASNDSAEPAAGQVDDPDPATAGTTALERPRSTVAEAEAEAPASDPEIAAEPNPDALPIPAPPSEVPSSQAAASDETAVTTIEPDTDIDGVESEPSEETIDASSTDGEPAPASGPDTVSLTFTGPCWVDIRDATREVLLFGEMARGDRKQLDGQPPYSLVIGNAAAVEMTVGGSPYDVRAVARGNVARFEVDPRNLETVPETTE